jgi:four helix bundle protein
MATYKNFEELDIWKDAISLAEEIYKLTLKGELAKDWGMKDQIRRSVASISNNIAEGFEYNNNRDFVKFLRYAKGSTGEFRNQLIILHRVNMINKEIYELMYKRTFELGTKIGKLINYLRQYEKLKNNS